MALSLEERKPSVRWPPAVTLKSRQKPLIAWFGSLALS